jgi:hypothetical protein
MFRKWPLSLSSLWINPLDVLRMFLSSKNYHGHNNANKNVENIYDINEEAITKVFC